MKRKLLITLTLALSIALPQSSVVASPVFTSHVSLAASVAGNKVSSFEMAKKKNCKASQVKASAASKNLNIKIKNTSKCKMSLRIYIDVDYVDYGYPSYSYDSVIDTGNTSFTANSPANSTVYYEVPKKLRDYAKSIGANRIVITEIDYDVKKIYK